MERLSKSSSTCDAAAEEAEKTSELLSRNGLVDNGRVVVGGRVGEVLMARFRKGLLDLSWGDALNPSRGVSINDSIYKGETTYSWKKSLMSQQKGPRKPSDVEGRYSYSTNKRGGS